MKTHALKKSFEAGVSAKALKESGACKTQVDLFRRTFGSRKVAWTKHNLLKAHRAGLDTKYLLMFAEELPGKAIGLLEMEIIGPWVTISKKIRVRSDGIRIDIAKPMLKYRGEKARIVRRAKFYRGIRYFHLDVDDGEWCWSDDMFTKPAPKKIKWELV